MLPRQQCACSLSIVVGVSWWLSVRAKRSKSKSRADSKCFREKTIGVADFGLQSEQVDRSSAGGAPDGGWMEAEDPEEQEAMLWSIQEALERQTQQIGASACGATAVVDVLKALGVEVTPEEADRCVQTRLRRNEAPLPDYLLSRSEAGATHAQLIRGAQEASGGKVVGRFFHLYPRRRIRLVPWLARWIRKGAVPVATMNTQVAVADGEEVPDAWHHQLIFGVAPRAVFMTNPLDVVGEVEVHQRLCSQSVLLIRREDVLQRLTPDCSLSDLSQVQSDPRWRQLDVEGQVRRMMSEEEVEDGPRTAHISIPAAYGSGVTLFAPTGSDAAQQILQAPELPLL